MPKLCAAPGLTAEEGRALDRLPAGLTAAVRLVGRACAHRQSSRGLHVPAVAGSVGSSKQTVRRWIERFNAGRLAGLADPPRSGEPPAYTGEEVGVVIVAASTTPESLGLPFGG
ncbi:MAG: helix-turn-helix domain-containing protein [Chloroflexota bacterium]|nr:helix-turn-helix domain-containing protein [Chloroflexota bacterium]